MKKVLLFISLLFVYILSANAQESNKETPQLKGLWQLCKVHISEADSSKITLLSKTPTFKMFKDEGEFLILRIQISGAQSQARSISFTLTAAGTYETKKDNLYVEHIITHKFRPLIGTSCDIHYKIVNNKYLMTYFSIEKDNKGEKIKEWHNETWVRADEDLTRKVPENFIAEK